MSMPTTGCIKYGTCRKYYSKIRLLTRDQRFKCLTADSRVASVLLQRESYTLDMLDQCQQLNMLSSLLLNLPRELLVLTIDCLLYEDQVELVCTSKQAHRDLMRSHVRKLKLTHTRYTQLMMEGVFSQYLAKIEDPGRQLSVDAIDFQSSIESNSISFPSLAKLSVHFEDFENLQLLGQVSELNLTQRTSESSDAWKSEAFLVSLSEKKYNVKSLQIVNASRNSQELFPFIASLKSLTLLLFSCFGISLEYYRSLHSLELVSCNNVTDLSLFGDIHTLVLSSCKGITDLSPLKNNYEVSVKHCENVKDYSNCFDNCRKVRIELGYMYLEDDTKLAPTNAQKLKELSLCVAYKLTVEIYVQFTRLRELTLNFCSCVIDCKGLTMIPVLRLRSLHSLKTLNGLGINNKTVDICYCHGVKEFSPLKAVMRVIISRCDGLQSAKMLQGISDLTIDNCPFLHDYENFQGHKHLTLYNPDLRSNNLTLSYFTTESLTVNFSDCDWRGKRFHEIIHKMLPSGRKPAKRISITTQSKGEKQLKAYPSDVERVAELQNSYDVLKYTDNHLLLVHR